MFFALVIRSRQQRLKPAVGAAEVFRGGGGFSGGGGGFSGGGGSFGGGGAGGSW